MKPVPDSPIDVTEGQTHSKSNQILKQSEPIKTEVLQKHLCVDHYGHYLWIMINPLSAGTNDSFMSNFSGGKRLDGGYLWFFRSTERTIGAKKEKLTCILTCQDPLETWETKCQKLVCHRPVQLHMILITQGQIIKQYWACPSS